MKKILLAVSLLIFTLFCLAKPSVAAVRCETQYGGNEVCVTTGQLQINKEVFNPNPKVNAYIDNISSTNVDSTYGYNFVTSELVKFKLTIKNIGDDTLHNVKVVDALPSFLFFTGTTPAEFHYDSFNPGTTKEEYVEARVVSESQLLVDSDCNVNTATATSDEEENDKDIAGMCVTKKVLGISTLPKTGPSDTFLILSLSAFAGLSGIGLIKFSKKTN
ncbi:hypothetical protein COT64_03530 [Candidatus Shapirobacteria bacterium CG09_land_8_20_14_0_10_39_12]|uniref:DUF11 domain-containing protein n=1 Tax=Candidatus Shapirobacteria bacterium CG09_land_8_20_14_0_10_39_12 TaxID=1974885 RepID=A0A2H0WNP9_9BACT|nr:MAG: hypothetical protein COT64_03530 [Candidatus Shapirobacteria bacterium CG09_land_8_20_14_0_10_39_12]